MAVATKIKFGDYLDVTDEGGGVIRVDGCTPGGTSEETFPPFNEAIMALAATRDLRGYWRLGDGASPFADTSGHASGPNNMVKTTAGTPMTESVTGALQGADDDGAVRFNVMGAVDGDYLAAYPGTLYGTSAGTVCAWIKPMGSPAGAQNVVGTRDAGNGGWALALSGTLVVFHRYDLTGGVTSTGPPIAVDSWTFVAVEWSTTGVKMYFDGDLVYTDSTAYANSSMSGLYIGRRNPLSGGAQNAFQGAIDEVSVWGDLLTADEISTLADSGGLSLDPGVRDVINVFAAYTAHPNETVIATGSFTVTLPTALGSAGAEVVVKNAATGTITVAQVTAETIDGSTSSLSLTALKAVMLVSNGTGWYAIGGYP